MYKTSTNYAKSAGRLPELSTTQSKIFQTKDQLMKTKNLLLQRLSQKQPIEEPESEQNKPKIKHMRRSFIQFPLNNSGERFTSFKKINKLQTQQIFKEFPKLRSQSTHLRGMIKAEIVYNKNQIEKIRKVNQQKLKHQRQGVLKRLKQLTPAKMKKQVTIKQKFKAKAKKVKGISLSMNYQTYEHNLEICKPFIDYDAMPIPFDKGFYFIGGRKDGPIIQYCVENDKWRQLPIIKNLKPFGDCSWTIVNNNIYFFGGYYYFRQGFSMICNTLKILDLKQNSYVIQQFNEQKVKQRAFHHQCMYGQYLIISGGLDKDSHYLKSIQTYQIQNGFWNQLTINKMPVELSKGFAKHSTLALFHKRKIYSIYNQEQIVQYDPYIQEEGIYLFGGQNGLGDLNNKMFIIKVGFPSVNIIQTKISGKPPLPMRNTAMIRHKQYIIIHGGRNDEMRPFALNSMFFLELKTMNWIEVSGQKAPYRYSHNIAIMNQNIVILGGKTHQGLSKQVFIMPYQEMIQYL